jgi:uncharacterized protein (DUF305 family)
MNRSFTVSRTLCALAAGVALITTAGCAGGGGDYGAYGGTAGAAAGSDGGSGTAAGAAAGAGTDTAAGAGADAGAGTGAGTGADKAAYNEADVRFSQEMIPHHWQTIHIAALVADRSTDQYVRGLAEEITKEEGADIRLMAGWLRTWNVPVPSESAAAGHDMPGMISQSEISALEGRSGASFDKLWLTSLAKHLDTGVAMARKAVESGTHKGTKELAQRIVKGQEATIGEITRRLA